MGDFTRLLSLFSEFSTISFGSAEFMILLYLSIFLLALVCCIACDYDVTGVFSVNYTHSVPVVFTVSGVPAVAGDPPANIGVEISTCLPPHFPSPFSLTVRCMSYSTSTTTSQ
jgi:hypothetical protein